MFENKDVPLNNKFFKTIYRPESLADWLLQWTLYLSTISIYDLLVVVIKLHSNLFSETLINLSQNKI